MCFVRVRFERACKKIVSERYPLNVRELSWGTLINSNSVCFCIIV